MTDTESQSKRLLKNIAFYQQRGKVLRQSMLVSIGLMLDNLAICLWNQETNTWHGVGTQSALIILILNIS